MRSNLTFQETHLNGRWSALRKPRKRLSSSSKELLERIFLVKQSPNRRERELIAGKCGVTPLQIRVWVCTEKDFMSASAPSYVYTNFVAVH